MWRRYVRGIIVFLLCFLAIGSAVFADVGIEDEVSAYLIGDYETGEILEEYNIHRPMEVASISKLMSYLIIMDHINMGDVSLEDSIYIDKDIAEIEGSSLELEVGELFTLEELLKAAMVVSANDATYALAKYIAGTEESFVMMMNAKAKELGLSHSIYFNSTGLPYGELQNKMTTEDIFLLSKHILDRYPETLSITAIPFIEVPSRNYSKENTNPLLGKIEGVDGLKTGFTDRAGHCLVSTLMVGSSSKDGGFRLIGIVMGTESEEKREELSSRLMHYGINNYYKRVFANREKPVDKIGIPQSKEGVIEVYPIKDYSKVVRYDDKIEVDMLIDKNIQLPLREGDGIGRLVVSINGEVLEEIDLIVHKDIDKEGFFLWIIRNIGKLLFKLLKLVQSN